MNNLYLGLVHYPVMNKRGEVITTSVTNLDIHDISRSCCTFGVKRYFIITPLKAQHLLLNRILDHWKEDTSNAYNPDRYQALKLVTAVHTVEEAAAQIEQEEGKSPLWAVTAAKMESICGNSDALKERMKIDNLPCFLLFGTGWGLDKSLLSKADFRLGPIQSGRLEKGDAANTDGESYNHLSVRAAVSIYLDRLQAVNNND